jgi:hypothetical protein
MSKDSTNKGNYLELKDYTIMQNDVVTKAFKNAPLNNQMANMLYGRSHGKYLKGHCL